MNSDIIQLIGLGLLILAEQYMIAPWQFPVFAKMWDFIARITGTLSWLLGRLSVEARLNYFSVVSNVG